MGDDRGLVYSTDGSLPLPKFANKSASTHPKASRVPDDGVVRVGCERRRGGSVTMVYGLAKSDLDRISSELKRRCGTGGTVKDGVIELQGDRRDSVLAYLAGIGQRAKRMGG